MTHNLLAVVDHIVLATPSMDDGIRELAALLGLTPAAGGKHPKWRTQNALLSLGPSVYLELMGPDEQLSDPGYPRPFGIDRLASPHLVTWAVRSDDLDHVVSIANSEGLDLGEIQSGSRRRLDGTLLQWQMTDLTKDRENGVVPFFINWGSSPHPAAAAPQGCRLEQVRLCHPKPDRIRRFFSKLEIELLLEQGPAQITAVIQTPKGRITLH